MDKLRLAFRRSLEQGSDLKPRTIQQYVTAAGRLMRFCEERGWDLTTGDVPPDWADEFLKTLPASSVRRIMRGATLYVRFLDEEQGIRLPAADEEEEALGGEEVERFVAAAAEQPEPYATLLQLLPELPLSVRQLCALEMDGVLRDEDGLALLVGDETVRPTPRAERLLSRYLHGWRAREVPEPCRLLLARDDGEPLAAPAVTRRLQRTQQQAGLPVFRASALVQWDPPSAPARPGLAGLPPDEDEPGSSTDGSQPPLRLIVGAHGDEPDEEGDPSDVDEEADERLDVDGDLVEDDELDDGPEDDEIDGVASEGDEEPEGRDVSETGEENDDMDDGELGDDPEADRELDEYESPFRVYDRRKERAMKDDDERRGGRGGRRTARSRPSRTRAIDRFIPEHGSVAIAYRPPGGRVTMIGTFSTVDLYAEDESIVGFISRHLVPQYGGGTYLVYRFAGDRRPIFDVEMAEPPGRQRAAYDPGTPAAQLRDMVDVYERLAQRAPSHRDDDPDIETIFKVARILGVDPFRRDAGEPPALPPPAPGTPGHQMPGGTTVLPAAPMASPLEGVMVQMLEKAINNVMQPPPPQPDPLEQVQNLGKLIRSVRDLDGSNQDRDDEPRGALDKLADRILNSTFGEGLGNAAGQQLIEKTEDWFGGMSRTRSKPKRKRTAPGESQRPAKARRPPPREPREPREPNEAAKLPDEMPARFGRLADKIREAETEEALLEALVRAIASLHLDRRWRPQAQRLLNAVVGDRRERAVGELMRVLEVAVMQGHLDEDTARLAAASASEHWTQLRERIVQLARMAAQRGGGGEE